MQAVDGVDELGVRRWLLVDEAGRSIEIVGRFLRFLQNRAMSPNTVQAYARDLTHFFRFLDQRQVGFGDVGPAVIVDFLEYLTHLPVRRPGKRQALAVVTTDAQGAGRRRAATSINRTMAAVSSFYEFVITVEEYAADNPVRKVDDVLENFFGPHLSLPAASLHRRPPRRGRRLVPDHPHHRARHPRRAA
jgi:hypothetical protein